MSVNLGDFRLGETFDLKFTTRQISGAPHALAGSPVISAYVGNSTTQITAGITLTVDFDGVVGLNNIRVVATSGNGYATASNYQLVITTGTVNSVSVVGEVIGSFSIENRKLGVNSINRAAFDPDSGLQTIRSGTAQAGAASTITLDAGASATDNAYPSYGILLTGGTGVGQFNIIDSYVGATKVATVENTWVTNPDSTTTFAIVPTAASIADIAAMVWAAATRTLTAGTNINGSTFTAIPWNAAWDTEVQSEVQDALDGTVADSVPADGTRPSISQAAYMLTQFMLERSVSGTTLTVKKPDGSTTLMTLTLNDAISPTSITRAT